GVLLAQLQDLVAEQIDPSPNPMYSIPWDQRIVVVMGGDVEAIGVGEAEVGLDPALHLQRVLLTGGDQRADPAALAAEQAVQHRGAAEDGGLDPREALLRRRVP